MTRDTTRKAFSRGIFLCVMASIAPTSGRRLISGGGLGRLSAAFAGARPSPAPPRSPRPTTRRYRLLPPWPRCASGGPRFSTAATEGVPPPPSSEEREQAVALPFEKHPHNSVKITVPAARRGAEDPYDDAAFRAKLDATVAVARRLGKSAVWLDVPLSRARLMEAAGAAGFAFHHAEGDTAALSQWLRPAEESRIPAYATHQVGVGAVVVRPDTGAVLCVREARRNYRPWKVPGGLAELGEGLEAAAVREVREETGVRTRFRSVLAVRHTHGAQFGRSDLYFVCELEPIPDERGEIPEPAPQEGEIAAARWLPADEYRAMVHGDEDDDGHPMMSLVIKALDSHSSMQRTIISSVVPGRGDSPLYHAPIAAEDDGTAA